MRWLKSLFSRDKREIEFERELQFHIDEVTREKVAQGMPYPEARRQAMLEFGGKEQTAQQLRDVHGVALLERTLANLTAGFRLMRKAPGFSMAVILTLALGIGANSAVFSAIDAVLLRPLPFPHSNDLMLLRQYDPRSKTAINFVAPVRLQDWSRMNSSFRSISGYYTEDVSELSGELPEKVTLAFVAPNFLQALGVAPALGRDFTSEEETFHGPGAVLISDRFWHRRFQGDPDAVGKRVRIGHTPEPIVVGIMPASFAFPARDVDMWSPVAVDAPFAQDRESTWYTIIGRLKPEVTPAQARADMATVQSQLGRRFPATDARLAVDVQPLKETKVGGVRSSLWILFGSVTLLLLIACTNIAALLLARATQREHEISVRFALGASRRAVIAQLLTETFVLSLVGSLLGLGVATAAPKIFRLLAGNLPRVEEIGFDWRIISYSLLCALAVTFLCGLLPARFATRGLAASLAEHNRTQVSGRSPMHWILVGVQVALAVTLLFGAGLLLRSFQELGRVTPGFDPRHVLALHISASWGETADMKALTQRVNRTLDVLRAVPGVEAAATSASLPGVGDEYQLPLKIAEGQQDPTRKISADIRFVSPGYFDVMRIPMLEGEPCRNSGGSTGIVVNRSFATLYFLQKPPLGHHLTLGASTAYSLSGEVRGVAGDAREQGLNVEPIPTVYWCMSAPSPDPHYLVRTRGEPMAMAETLRRALRQVEPNRSVFDLLPLESHLSNAFAEDRLRTILLTIFALTAVSLACVGLYGTLAYLVTVRNREIGLRLALGAMRSQVMRRYIAQGMRVALIGCACGLLLAVAVSRVLAGMLFGVSSLDPTTLLGVIFLVLMVAGLAALIPALRASRTDPMQVLREQ
jgi:putative ABC transport system permease protein